MLEPARPDHDHPPICVIAQQYSSAAFVSLRFHPRREKFGAGSNMSSLHFHTSFNTAYLEKAPSRREPLPVFTVREAVSKMTWLRVED